MPPAPPTSIDSPPSSGPRGPMSCSSRRVDRITARSGPADHPAELARRGGFEVAFRRTIPFQGGDYGLAVLAWP
jgi:hypothetical protein